MLAISQVTYAACMTGKIVKRVHVLADGRELIYFDDADTSLPPDRAPDLRELGRRPPTGMMRQDLLTGEWISIAVERQNRVVMPTASLDPLAPQSPGNPSEIPSSYDVAVFENRSPAFGPALPGSGSPEADPAYLEGSRLARQAPAFGRCEVVCFSSAGDGAFGSVSMARTVSQSARILLRVIRAATLRDRVFSTRPQPRVCSSCCAASITRGSGMRLAACTAAK